MQHGYPLRVFIPSHYGMKQPKWITKIEAIDQEGAGYWVDRGWSEDAIPKTTWQSEPGRHTFRVRAYDGDGDLQETKPTEPHPDGASGIHLVTESVRS